MRKTITKTIAIAVAISLIGTLTMSETKKTKAAADYELSNPRVKELQRESVYFGNYWQENTNEDYIVDKEDEKKPIKWQIISKDKAKGTALLLADQVLDKYEDKNESEPVTWEMSELRAWLNNEFINNAFSNEEQEKILDTKLVNADNEKFDTNGGNDTTDKIYLLSLDEIKNTSYGFNEKLDYCDQARVAKLTSYAKFQGVSYTSEGERCDWLLRSPGSESYSSKIDDEGSVYYNSRRSGYVGVRPALQINLSSLDLLTKADKVGVALLGSEWDTITFGTYKGKPIIWRVLKVEGDDAFLISDKLLEKKEYNVEEESVTWENCTLRKWLNDDFINSAFSEIERTAIKTTKVVNAENEEFNTSGGNDTEDKIFLLSLDEIKMLDYGFSNMARTPSESRSASCVGDEWARCWWLRSPGFESKRVASVNSDGKVWVGGDRMNYDDYGVRPVLHISLSDTSLWKKNSVVSVGNVVDEAESEVPEETMVPIETPTVAPTIVPTDVPGEPQPTVAPTIVPTDVPGEPQPTVAPTMKPAENTNETEKSNTSVKKPAKVTIVSAKNNKKKMITIKIKTAKNAKKYKVQYATDKKFKKIQTITVKNTKILLKKLKKKTYYIRICGVNGQKVGPWSRVKKVKVEK